MTVSRRALLRAALVAPIAFATLAVIEPISSFADSGSGALGSTRAGPAGAPGALATDPCGQIRYSVPLDNNDYQDVARVDFQLSANHTIFGRYINSWEHRLQTLSRTGNVLTVNRDYGANKRARANMAVHPFHGTPSAPKGTMANATMP